MFNIYTVTFAGHRYVKSYTDIKPKVYSLVCDIIRINQYVDFLVGRNGEFDQIASSTVIHAKKSVFDANSSLIWVMPYATKEYLNNEAYYKNYYDEIEICQASAAGHFKAAIQKRNRYMVSRADLLICYVEHAHGGAYQTMRYAVKEGKKVINIYDLIK